MRTPRLHGSWVRKGVRIPQVGGIAPGRALEDEWRDKAPQNFREGILQAGPPKKQEEPGVAS